MSVHENVQTQDGIKKAVFASLFAALIAVGSYILIPLPFSPVPVALQSFFILLAGLILGRKWGLAAVAVFLAAGALGLPVFAGGKGGFVHFAGPTGGYLFSYLPAVFLVSMIAGRGRHSRVRVLIALLSGSAVIYLFGVSWLGFSLKISAGKAFSMGMLPFLAGDALKIAAAMFVAPMIRGITEPYADIENPEQTIAVKEVSAG